MNAPRSETPGPPRPLDPRIEQTLVDALKALFSADPTEAARQALQDAVVAAARDARARKLRPEELVLAFKALEQRAGYSVPEKPTRGERPRSQMIQALLDAYYAADKD
jgi:hypothetical protein